MTYLGSGIWSYTCWKKDSVLLLSLSESQSVLSAGGGLHAHLPTHRQVGPNPANIYSAILFSSSTALSSYKGKVEVNRLLTTSKSSIPSSISLHFTDTITKHRCFRAGVGLFLKVLVDRGLNLKWIRTECLHLVNKESPEMCAPCVRCNSVTRHVNELFV